MGIKGNIAFKYSFVGMGSIVSPDSPNPLLQPQPNRIFLDVGNALQVGVIDHHHGSTGVEAAGKLYKSATGLLWRCRSLVLDNLTDDASEVELVVHYNVDFDCVATVYLAQHLIAYGDFPDYSELLVDYAERVDAGYTMLRPDQLRTPYTVMCAMSEVVREQMVDVTRDVTAQAARGQFNA